MNTKKIIKLIAVLALFSLTLATSAQTLVPPGVPSGHWNLAGSPYIVVDNISVPSGQTLTIDPGVTVLIGSNLTITANGSLIQAVGTPSQRITIGSLSSSYYFNAILVQNQTGTNRFKYCDFANAQTAISMTVYGYNQVMPMEIMNCTFSNCVSQGIYGEAQGIEFWNGGYYYSDAILNPVIKNCVFDTTGNGCVMKIFGMRDCGQFCYTGYGYSNTKIIGNNFITLPEPRFSCKSAATPGVEAQFSLTT